MSYFDKFYINPVGSDQAKVFYSNLIGHDIQPDQEFVCIVHDVIRDMHSLDQTELLNVLEYLFVNDQYLLDIILICWCLPSGFGKRQRFKNYKKLIEEQGCKLYQLIDTDPIRQFGVMVTRDLPVHCIDLIWPYVTEPYEIIWLESVVGDTIKIVHGEYVKISVCALTVFELGLGNTGKPTLRELVMSIKNCPSAVQVLRSIKSPLVKQLDHLDVL